MTPSAIHLTTVKGLLFLLFVIVSPFTFSQTDNAGPGRAISFDGVDDYIDLGNIYDDLVVPFTVSAWVYAPAFFSTIPILVSQDNDNIYNGFWFCLSPTRLFVEYGDGGGEQSDAYRRGKAADVPNLQGRWLHVSAVVNSGNDIALYAHGLNVGGSYTGLSTLPMASNYPTSVAKVGFYSTNSNIFRFKGQIDEVRIWNRSLTQEEVRETMCRRLKGDEQGLIGYWNFDETSGDVAKDLSSNGFDGKLMGSPTRVYSGAPVGDKSAYLYTTTWFIKRVGYGRPDGFKHSGKPIWCSDLQR